MTYSFEKYREFTQNQFVLDDNFIDWVKCPTDERNFFWEKFLKEYPQQSDNVRQAKRLVSKIRVENETIGQETKNRIWKAIKTQAAQPGPVVQIRSRRWLIGVAAAVLIVAASAVFFQLNAPSDIMVIQTAFGEKRTINLPDESVVVLNAASKIEFKKDWTANAPREVWIRGEAYFNVVHKNKTGTPVQPFERFIVHLKNMDVEVLGTTFTVNTRRNEEQVVLQTGSVKVNLKNNAKEVYLRPGEMVQYHKEDSTLSKETTNASDHALWKDSQLKFNNTSLNEVIQLMEDSYGYKVIIADSSLLDRKITGTLSSENESVLFKALETMLDVKISVSAKTVTISKK
jgi:transmembrane sensor